MRAKVKGKSDVEVIVNLQIGIVAWNVAKCSADFLW